MTEEQKTAYLSKLDGVIAKYGWAVQAVVPNAGDKDMGPETNGAPFAYTVGLALRGRPELLIINRLSGPQMQAILNDFAMKSLQPDSPIKHGAKVKLGDGSGTLPLLISKVTDADLIKALTPVARAFSPGDKPVELLQVLTPDKNGLYPGDEGYSTSYDDVPRLPSLVN